MANNIPALKTEIFNLLANTTNLDATTKQKLRDRFVSEFAADWAVYLNANGSDTAALRGQFVIQKTFDNWYRIYQAGSNRENQAQLPPPEILQ